MGEESSVYFDLPVLLRTNGLDPRKAARNNLSLHTGEYFGLLSRFLSYMPQVRGNLEKISALDGNEYDFNRIEDAGKLLESIGFDKLFADFSEIAGIGINGSKEKAADCAKKILSNFDVCYSQIIAARKERKSDTAAGVLNMDKTYEQYETQLFHKVLKILDHDEATRKMRILAVDDAPIILKTISSILSEDYKVYGMSNPTKLEDFLKQITPELFLLDYKMPELSGFDLIPIIRNFEEHKTTPIIFLTSMGTADHVSAAFALGACDYIVKPFQGKQLREKIAKHIVRKKLF